MRRSTLLDKVRIVLQRDKELHISKNVKNCHIPLPDEKEHLKEIIPKKDPDSTTTDSSDSDSVSKHSEGDENKRRGNWGNHIDFILSCVGYAVGLGNIWRFPYLCMRNGGGAFLIPYFTFLVIGGIPLFFMELIIGQFSSLSPLSVWALCPLFKGLGWGMVVISCIVSIYYNIILTWVLYFLGLSFQSPLPWANCNNAWNTEFCLERGTKDFNDSLVNTTSNSTFGEAIFKLSNPELPSSNLTLNVTARKQMTPAEEFWQYNVLEMSDGIENLGGIRWQLVVCHIVGWIIVFLCLIKGVKSLGKVVYVTATLPYLFLTILLIRGCTMPGSLKGILYYLNPDFSKLKEFRIWAEACLQIFYSLGPAWGGLITMSSYNKFHNNVYRDAIIVPIVNCLTSFYAGFVIFSVVGYMAHEAQLPVDQVLTSGPGLAFVAYPEALTKLPWAPVWAVSFFVMLLTIGLDSQFGMFETLVSSIVDSFPKRLRGKKIYVTGFVAIIELLIGLIFCTRAGIYIFQIVDWYAAFFSVTLIAALESLVISHLYGMDRLIGDLKMMIGYRVGRGWKLLWGLATPVTMLVCLIYSIVSLDSPKYGDYEYPKSACVFGMMIGCISVVPIPVLMIKTLVEAEGSFLQRLRTSIKPSELWGPALSRHRKHTIYNQQERDMIKSDLSMVESNEEPQERLVEYDEKCDSNL